MLSMNSKITLRQMQILIILSAMGTGLMVLPRRVAQYAAQDGWLIVLGVTIVGMVITALIIKAVRVKPQANFVEYTAYALSRPVALILAVVLWIKLVFSAGLIMRFFILITQDVLLPQTPKFIVSGVIIGVCAYAAYMGIEARARIAEVLFMFIVLPILFLFIIALMDIDFTQLQPMFTASPVNILRGTWRLGFMFTGLECLLLIGPYINKQQKIGRTAVTAVAFSGIIITVITVITIAKFGASVVDEPWPVLRMMDLLPLPGAFIERQEALMFSFWIITVFLFVNALIFFGARLLKDITRKQTSHRLIFVAITALAVFFVTLISWEADDVFARLDDIYFTLGIFFLIIFPVFVIMGAYLRNKFAKNRHVSAVIMLLCCSFFFTGCYDRVEIEDRSFVAVLGLDASPEGYALTVKEEVYEALTITEAMYDASKDKNKALSYGQVKILVLGEELLSDAPLLSHAISALILDPAIDRQLHVVTQEDVSDVYDSVDNIDLGNYKLTLQMLKEQLMDNGCVLVPKLPAGAVVVSAAPHTGKDENENPLLLLCEKQLQGFLWLFDNKNKNTVISVKYNDSPIAYKIKKHHAEVVFKPPHVFIDIYVEGYVAEQGDIAVSTITHLIANQINEEITQTASLLQAHVMDAYHWLDKMRKSQYNTFVEVGHRWLTLYPHLIIEPRVFVQ